jgi:hypothetical protein
MASSDACIGQRVKVFWSGDDEWYDGEIDDMRGFDYKPPTVEAHVVYRDGEKKWHNLANEQWEQIGQAPQQAVSQQQCPEGPSVQAPAQLAAQSRVIVHDQRLLAQLIADPEAEEAKRHATRVKLAGRGVDNADLIMTADGARRRCEKASVEQQHQGDALREEAERESAVSTGNKHLGRADFLARSHALMDSQERQSNAVILSGASDEERAKSSMKVAAVRLAREQQAAAEERCASKITWLGPSPNTALPDHAKFDFITLKVDARGGGKVGARWKTVRTTGSTQRSELGKMSDASYASNHHRLMLAIKEKKSGRPPSPMHVFRMSEEAVRPKSMGGVGLLTGSGALAAMRLPTPASRTTTMPVRLMKRLYSHVYVPMRKLDMPMIKRNELVAGFIEYFTCFGLLETEMERLLLPYSTASKSADYKVRLSY